MFFLETMEICALKLKVKDFLCNMQRCNTSLQNHSSLSEVYLMRGNKKEKKTTLLFTLSCTHTLFSHAHVLLYTQPMPGGTLFMANQRDTGGCVLQQSS